VANDAIILALALLAAAALFRRRKVRGEVLHLSPRWGRRSLARMETLDPRLRAVLDAAIRRQDLTVLSTHRTEEEQRSAVATGRSQTMDSAHRVTPALAVDVAPYPIDWNNVARFEDLAAIILEEGRIRGLDLVWGGAWDGSRNRPGGFDDLGHFQIRNWRQQRPAVQLKPDLARKRS
jgi:peptidoglycan L-alanyl-D-glutamate endopeptidase CwlK